MLGHVQTTLVLISVVLTLVLEILHVHVGFGAIPDKSTALQNLAEVKSGSKESCRSQQGLSGANLSISIISESCFPLLSGD